MPLYPILSLICAVANNSPTIIKMVNKIPIKQTHLEPVLKRMLSDLGESHPSVGDVRSIGLFGILELVKDRKTKEPITPWNGSSPEM